MPTKYHPFQVVLAFMAMFFIACAPGSTITFDPTVPTTNVSAGAAFVDLAYADVYDEAGEYITTIGEENEFNVQLPIGYYLMDFVAANGEHSFIADGRLAFAPMMQGGLPVHGPIDVEGFDAPLWGVEVHPDLEANARLTQRVRDEDETLLPFKDYFKFWGEGSEPNLGANPYETDGRRAWSVTHNSTSSRLRVTWEASYAMTGDWNGSCNNTTTCWNGRIGGYAFWDKDNSGTGYIDSDTSAWSNALGTYPGGAGSCAGSPGCVTVGTSNARNYTCQSSAGICTGGSSGTATKPRGGQCKMFSNIVFWRSGEYNNWGPWKKLPTDDIAPMTTQPIATTGTISVGDVLRRETSKGVPHSVIVVAWNTSIYKALVIDSNWTGGAGQEYIGWRELGFTGSNTVSDLGTYKRTHCLYNATPC